MKDADELPPQILWLRGYEMKGKKANPFAESTLQADNDVRAKWIKAGCWTAFILLALLEVWTGRNYTDPDGISYIDMSDGVLAHNWRLLVNAYWSPLYPFLLGAARWILRPSAYWELPAVHCVNFVIFLITLACFSYFFKGASLATRQDDRAHGPEMGLPTPVWTFAGYSLFAWSTFVLVNGIRKVCPDLCVAAFVYLDAGLLLRLRVKANKLPTFLLLGITLGLGYYAKAFMFPMAFVFIAAAFFQAGEWRKAIVPSVAMIAVFSAIAAPLIIATTETAGHVTFGDTGANNYARYVCGEPTLPFYSSVPPRYLTHPLDLLHHSPNVYGFGQPFHSTYPLWYDVSYWDAGFKNSFNLDAQLRAVVQNLNTVFNQVILPIGVSLVAYLVLFVMGPGLAGSLWNISRSWPLIGPGAAGVCLYLSVYVEPRHIGAFVVLIGMGLLSAIRVRGTPRPMKIAKVAALTLAGWLFILSAGLPIYHMVRPLPMLLGDGGSYFPVAKSLNTSGLRPGQTVGIIGSGWDAMMWAREARLRIVAQIPLESTSEFWQIQNPRGKAEVYDAFRKAGARAVVTEETPPSSGFDDWQRVGNTSYFMHVLIPAGSTMLVR